MLDIKDIRDDKFFELIRVKLARELMRFAPKTLTECEINDLVEELMQKVEWQNVFLEAVFSWVARIYWDTQERIEI